MVHMTQHFPVCAMALLMASSPLSLQAGATRPSASVSRSAPAPSAGLEAVGPTAALPALPSSSLYLGADGRGSVQSSPSGTSYPKRATVTLTAVASPGWVFDHWGGDVTSTANPLKVRMLTDRDITAFFTCVSCGSIGSAYVPGQTYMGRNQYIEYQAGNLPLIISAPHGGYQTPDELPDRADGTSTNDAYTQELVRAINEAVHQRLGGYPHLVINHLDRVKLDPNREEAEGAGDDPLTQQAWEEFHRFIEEAEAAVEVSQGMGLYVDIHGQSDDPDRLLLGYLLTTLDLQKSDATLSSPTYMDLSSIRSLAYTVDVPFATLLRGASSLGGLFEAAGYPSVPSPTSPDPGRSTYYSGGYDTEVHGSRDEGTVDGVQIEANYAVRESEAARLGFASAFTGAIQAYLVGWYPW